MLKKKIATYATALITLTLIACGQIAESDFRIPENIGTGGFGSTNTTAPAAEIEMALQNIDYLFVNDNPNPKNRPYSREAQFGQAWTDNNDMPLGYNGCDTRNDILNRDLVQITHKDKKGCVVLTGVLENDPYTGRTIKFRRGETTSRLVQIEHIVSLKNAWDSGAYTWTQQERVNFANDPDVLIAVDGPENQAKGDKSADKWLVPNNPAYRCTYAAKQVNIKTTYGLSVTTPEKLALKQTLQTC